MDAAENQSQDTIARGASLGLFQWVLCGRAFVPCRDAGGGSSQVAGITVRQSLLPVTPPRLFTVSWELFLPLCRSGLLSGLVILGGLPFIRTS